MNQNNEQKPIAWAFYNNDGSIRFIIDDEKRMLAWKTAHNGYIVPLVPMKPEIKYSNNN